MKITLPAFISPVPIQQINFGDDSIIIEDYEGWNEYLVGQAASMESFKSHRQVGGTLCRPQYQRLLRALVAKSLGEGEHKITISMASSLLWIHRFREKIEHVTLSHENYNLLSKILKDIRFKEKSNTSEWKTCRVVLEEPAFIFLEVQAVSMVIPKGLKSYILWQMGHGDLQQVVLIDNRPQSSTLAQAEGLIGAIDKFAQMTNLSESQAIQAWQSNTLPTNEGMGNERKDASQFKQKAIQGYYNEVFASLMNKTEKYKERATNIILSGGAVKDNMFVGALKKEIEADGIFELHNINDLPIKDERCNDPSFTCVYGLLQGARDAGIKSKVLALDVGNSYLKSILD